MINIQGHRVPTEAQSYSLSVSSTRRKPAELNAPKREPQDAILQRRPRDVLPLGADLKHVHSESVLPLEALSRPGDLVDPLVRIGVRLVDGAATVEVSESHDEREGRRTSSRCCGAVREERTSKTSRSSCKG